MITKRFESRPVGWVKTGLFAIATLITLWSQTSVTAIFWAVSLSIVGSQLGRSLSKRHLKLKIALMGTAIGLLLSYLLPSGIRNSDVVFGWLNARNTLVLADVIAFGLLVFSTCFGVRYLSTRWRVWSVIEAGIVVSSVALLFARHRNMAFHRPYFLTDWALVNGMDPQLILQGIGVATATVAVMMLLWKQSRQKLILSTLVLFILGLLAYQFRGDMKADMPISRLLDKSAQDGKNKNGKNGKGNQKDNQGNSGGSGSGGQPPPDPPLPVAVALLHSDYKPEGDLLYFRQQVLGQFNGKRLVADPSGTFDNDVIRDFAHDDVLKATPSQSPAFHRRVPTSMFLMVDHPQPVALTASIEIRPRVNPSPNRFVAAYDVVSLAPSAPIHEKRYLGRGSVDPSWSPEKKAYFTTHPDDPRYEALANEIVREVDPRYANDTLIRALAIKRYLEENGFYTLKERHDNAEDPTASFLFGNLRGYCVHFAHSAVHLFRSVGIASRVALGYAVDNRMRGNGSAVLIMGDRAHAWPEIHIVGVGWIPFDIYPEQSDQPPPQLVSQSLESLMGELARNDKSGGRAAEPKNEAFSIPWQQIQAFTLLSILFLLGLAYLIKVVRQIRAAYGTSIKQHWLFSATLDRLSDVGLARTYGETREHHAVRIQSLVPSFQQLTATHLHLSLGTTGSSAEMPNLCAQVRQELKKNLPWWKRILGLLNPVGWCFTR
jgi:hypothetical protein